MEHVLKSVVFLATCLTVASCAGTKVRPSAEMISIGSHRLQIHREGSGMPTVVIDAGLADQLDKWRPLQDRIARVTQVITYNRAGYGRSEPGPMPRDAGREAKELRALLEKASVPGPYVLVGHSLGALNVEVFASMYPDEVAGMVLLDPPPLSFIRGRAHQELAGMAEQMTRAWEATADSAARSPNGQDRARAAFFRAIASEQRELFGTSAALADTISTFGDGPLGVLAAGKPNPAFGEVADEFQRYWVEQSRALVSKSTRGAFVFVQAASHDLYQDAPDTVATSVLSLVAELRGQER
jgi:pimeloyl-ACP methyl ester carboxylesterase